MTDVERNEHGKRTFDDMIDGETEGTECRKRPRRDNASEVAPNLPASTSPSTSAADHATPHEQEPRDNRNAAVAADGTGAMEVETETAANGWSNQIYALHEVSAETFFDLRLAYNGVIQQLCKSLSIDDLLALLRVSKKLCFLFQYHKIWELLKPHSIILPSECARSQVISFFRATQKRALFQLSLVRCDKNGKRSLTTRFDRKMGFVFTLQNIAFTPITIIRYSFKQNDLSSLVGADAEISWTIVLRRFDGPKGRASTVYRWTLPVHIEPHKPEGDELLTLQPSETAECSRVIYKLPYVRCQTTAVVDNAKNAEGKSIRQLFAWNSGYIYDCRFLVQLEYTCRNATNGVWNGTLTSTAAFLNIRKPH